MRNILSKKNLIVAGGVVALGLGLTKSTLNSSGGWNFPSFGGDIDEDNPGGSLPPPPPPSTEYIVDLPQTEESFGPYPLDPVYDSLRSVLIDAYLTEPTEDKIIYWQEKMGEDDKSVEDVAKMILYHHFGVVTRLYWKYYTRTLTPKEIREEGSKLLRGGIENYYENFIRLAEASTLTEGIGIYILDTWRVDYNFMYTNSLRNREFLYELYKNILQRPPDDPSVVAGINNWESHLIEGGIRRHDMIGIFLRSTEFKLITCFKYLMPYQWNPAKGITHETFVSFWNAPIHDLNNKDFVAWFKRHRVMAIFVEIDFRGQYQRVYVPSTGSENTLDLTRNAYEFLAHNIGSMLVPWGCTVTCGDFDSGNVIGVLAQGEHRNLAWGSKVGWMRIKWEM